MMRRNGLGGWHGRTGGLVTGGCHWPSQSQCQTLTNLRLIGKRLDTY